MTGKCARRAARSAVTVVNFKTSDIRKSNGNLPVLVTDLFIRLSCRNWTSNITTMSRCQRQRANSSSQWGWMAFELRPECPYVCG